MSDLHEKAADALAGMRETADLLRRRGRYADARAAERLRDQYARWIEGMFERLDAGATVIDLERHRRRRA